jgi:LPPG:FO 2-phospho-L-lactate transferase
VSPFVGGRVLKGPTEAFMENAGHERSAAGVASIYAGVADGIVTDEPALLAEVVVQTATPLRRAA